jgi:hypothetical protein
VGDEHQDFLDRRVDDEAQSKEGVVRVAMEKASTHGIIQLSCIPTSCTRSSRRPRSKTSTRGRSAYASSSCKPSRDAAMVQEHRGSSKAQSSCRNCKWK